MLITCSVIFVVGLWIGGLCPGPSIAILSNHFFPAIIFTVSMIVGIIVGSILFKPNKLDVN